jgi:t-SNARE syntaxin family protein
MGRELEDQAIMLEEVDTLAERVGGKLSSGMKRIRHVVRENEGKFDQVYFYCLLLLQDNCSVLGVG